MTNPTKIATEILNDIYNSENSLDEILQLSEIDSWEILQLLEVAKMLNKKLDTKTITKNK